MQFLLYLSTQTMDIYNLVSKKVRVVENPPICRQYDFFGFYDSKQKVLSICTSRIKSHGNIENYVSETLLHESVHVAQSCKTNFKYLTPFGINQSSMDLNYQRENDLKKVIAFNTYLREIDREAFWMEDKPNQVKYVLKKYCF